MKRFLERFRKVKTFLIKYTIWKKKKKTESPKNNWKSYQALKEKGKLTTSHWS